MRNLAWTPVLLALALTGCPDKDTGDTDDGTDTEVGTDPDTDTEADTEADTDPPGPQVGDVAFFEGFETDGIAFPDGWVATTAEGANADVFWKLCETGVDCDGNFGAELNLADGEYYAAIDADGDGSSGLADGELYQGTLTSAAIDLSEYGDFNIVMTLDQYYRDLNDVDAASIEVSSDDGATWIVIQDHPAIDIDTERDNNSTANGPCPSIYDMSAYAGETIQLRFNYTAGWDWWFMVDNIQMVLADTVPALPTPDAWTCPLEVCDDATDNDLDFFTDCGDADCAEDALCTDVCVAEAIALPATGQGATPVDMTSNLDWASGPDCSTGSGSELVFSIDAEAGDVIVASELNSSFDGVIRITDGCTAGTATCLASVDSGDSATFTAVDAGTYYVVIEGYSSSESDDFEYVIGLNPADAEDCTSGIDDDLDGAIDCADSECSDEAQCIEVCDSGLDEDADGLIDCDDLDDCFNTVECPYECPADAPVAFVDGLFEDSGDFADLEALPYGDGEDCGYANGLGKIWQVSLEANSQYLFEAIGDTDTVVRLLDTCAPGDACLDSSDTPEELRYATGDTPETVYFVMEAYFSSTTTGPWAVAMTLLDNEICTTDVDEDLDGDIGCDDSDCAMDVACYELDCTDGVSGDDDDLIDCMDPDCDDSVDCVELDCADGIDNDLDGDIDCLDTQCLGTAACPEIECDDGLDNDDDSAIDCADSDCDAEEICYECPTELTLPATFTGSDFATDYPDMWKFTSGGGCQGTGSGDGAGDAVFPVFANAGDTISLTHNVDSTDWALNVTTDGCNPAQSENTCVYSDDDPDNYSFVAEESGIYNLNLTTYSSTGSDAYDFTIDVVAPEQCDTTEDEDLDGDAGCDDSECTYTPDCYTCAAAETTLPATFTGDNWEVDNPDVFNFPSGSGCRTSGTGELAITLDLAIGDVVDFTDNDGADLQLSVSTDFCAPAPDIECVFSDDDESGAGTGIDNYSYTAEESGLHYFVLTAFSFSSSRAYDFSVDVTPAP